MGAVVDMASRRQPAGGDARRLRLAYVITGLELGGGGAVVLTLARALDRTRFDLDVYCILEGGDMEAELRGLGFGVHILPRAFDYRRRVLRYSPTKTLQLASMLRRGQYDVVHTHLFQADAIGRVAAKLAGIPVIVKSLHNMGRWKTRGQVLTDRVLNRWTDRVICCSDYQREIAQAQEGFAPEIALTIPHGVKLERFPARVDRAALLTSLGLDPRRVTVGTVGRPIAEKGHEHLLDAVPAILARHPETQFLVVGEGGLRRPLEARVEAMGLSDRVRFAGARDDVPGMMAVMDIFAFPSLSEGFGIAIIEAMASGLPVVASRIRPLTEIVVEGRTGLFAAAGNGASFADALNRLLASDELRRDMGRAGRALVEARYTDRQMVGAHQDLYLSLHRAASRRGQARTSDALSNRRTPGGATIGSRADV